ncbi:hypothetical protein AB6870_24590 [Rahnella inusitata]|uniref:hypothetical protein n=1 Tax=Rahnella inusitata TaxID=58169 RepID=UPI0039BE9373
MTNTTDMAALREACGILNDHGYLTKSGKIRSSNLAEAVRMIIEQSVGYAEQLEAERQRADYGQQVIDQRNAEYDRLINELAALKDERNDLVKLLAQKEAESDSELKGEQVPVAVVELNDNLSVAEIRGDIPRRKAVRELYEGALVLGQELFGAPQRPVISKAKLCDWLEYNFDIDDSQRDAFANCFAHHCNCIVKKED